MGGSPGRHEFSVAPDQDDHDLQQPVRDLGGAKLVGPARDRRGAARHPATASTRRASAGSGWGRAFEKQAAESYRDPLKQISHGATARQTARFYVRCSTRGTSSRRYWSEWMLARMGSARVRAQVLSRRCGERPGVTFVARKSGTWEDIYHSDSALIQHDGFGATPSFGLAAHRGGRDHDACGSREIADDADRARGAPPVARRCYPQPRVIRGGATMRRHASSRNTALLALVLGAGLLATGSTAQRSGGSSPPRSSSAT